MNIFENGVPYDPGYAPYIQDLYTNISVIAEEVAKYKAHNQKKFKFSQFENTILSIIDNNAGFYLGCILWGAYIHYRFKDSPKKITGNPFFNLSNENLKEIDLYDDINFSVSYLEKFDKDCKYFLGRTAKTEKRIYEIFNDYREFLLLNGAFVKTENTDDIKIPEKYSFIGQFDNEKLDYIYNSITAAINSGKLEEILHINIQY